MDGRPNRRNKAVFSNYCGVAWPPPKKGLGILDSKNTFSKNI